MEMQQASNRIHPLVAGAAVSVMLVSLLGMAAITGVLPNSHGTAAPVAPVAVAPAPVAADADERTASAPVHAVQRKRVVHHAATQPVTYARNETVQPVYQQQAPVVQQNSPLGIGVGAVVGGLVGSQVGGGNGRTLATIAGAVGGGYLGNEVAKRNQ